MARHTPKAGRDATGPWRKEEAPPTSMAVDKEAIWASATAKKRAVHFATDMASLTFASVIAARRVTDAAG